MSTQATVNGTPITLTAETSLLDVVASTLERRLNPDGRPVDGGRLGVAVAVDGEVVPRGSWSDRRLSGGERLEIVTAVQGG
ncbi:sulfur carrier protein ThiS [Saxibacter everestensis]|uniref:Sulfur carrier protein ThiS n=1 Tax=Saxibacter everestensis TaxID=2909229 RepID=A0ABY8QNA1_9MICO|nr:sulfur carrier protein ThiS [Brevibacteriaceae bacterium ZFBP1038]